MAGFMYELDSLFPEMMGASASPALPSDDYVSGGIRTEPGHCLVELGRATIEQLPDAESRVTLPFRVIGLVFKSEEPLSESQKRCAQFVNNPQTPRAACWKIPTQAVPFLLAHLRKQQCRHPAECHIDPEDLLGLAGRQILLYHNPIGANPLEEVWDACVSDCDFCKSFKLHHRPQKSATTVNRAANLPETLQEPMRPSSTAALVPPGKDAKAIDNKSAASAEETSTNGPQRLAQPAPVVLVQIAADATTGTNGSLPDGEIVYFTSITHTELMKIRRLEDELKFQKAYCRELEAELRKQVPGASVFLTDQVCSRVKPRHSKHSFASVLKTRALATVKSATTPSGHALISMIEAATFS